MTLDPFIKKNNAKNNSSQIEVICTECKFKQKFNPYKEKIKGKYRKKICSNPKCELNKNRKTFTINPIEQKHLLELYYKSKQTNKKFKTIKLTKTQKKIHSILLSQKKNLTIKQILKLSHIPQSSLYSNIKNLVAQGIVKKILGSVNSYKLEIQYHDLDVIEPDLLKKDLYVIIHNAIIKFNIISMNSKKINWIEKENEIHDKITGKKIKVKENFTRMANGVKRGEFLSNEISIFVQYGRHSSTLWFFVKNEIGKDTNSLKEKLNKEKIFQYQDFLENEYGFKLNNPEINFSRAEYTHRRYDNTTYKTLENSICICQSSHRKEAEAKGEKTIDELSTIITNYPKLEEKVNQLENKIMDKMVAVLEKNNESIVKAIGIGFEKQNQIFTSVLNKIDEKNIQDNSSSKSDFYT